MGALPVYRDVLLALEAAARGAPLWPAFHDMAYRPHRAYFDGLAETYGPALLDPGGLPGTVSRLAPALHRALRPAPSYDMERRAGEILDALRPLLPGPLPPLYLATLFFAAPAATIAVGGRPAIALGLERFSPAPPPGPKYWYHPDEVVEMLPHEAAHAVRMEALGLPPTPRRLTLLDMVMLEGTALLFTDLLLGRETLATFMDPLRLAWHRAHDAEAVAAAARDFGAAGMPVFLRYFSREAPISGYWVGYSLCRRYLDRFGTGAMPELLCLPSVEILRRIA
ncbi:MAG: DUF2268 domain-containing putative Zn-dependent protease [Symbiobacterium sp.]|uniref:DUF2268 domain-containing putative Zn-dependent protease n=1 Tax=Symbiobacterium sp. TaxID=1971213 RepID=UPI00346495B9